MLSKKSTLLVILVILALSVAACGSATMLSPEEAKALEPWMSGEAPPPEDFTITSLELLCQNLNRQSLQGEFVIESCQETVDELTINSTLFVLTAATPWPGDEIIAGAKAIATIKNARNLIVAVVFLAATDMAVDQAMQIDVDTFITVDDLIVLSATTTLPRHSDPAHDPNVAGSWADTYITEFSLAWTTNGGPDPDKTNCAVMYVGDVATRIVYWTFTHTSALGGLNPLTGVIDGAVDRGNIIWTWITEKTSVVTPNTSNMAGGAYSNSSGKNFPSVPRDIKAQHPNARMQVEDCSNKPPPALP